MISGARPAAPAGLSSTFSSPDCYGKILAQNLMRIPEVAFFKGLLPHSDRGCGEWWIWSPNSSFYPQNVVLEVVFLWGITSRCMRLRLNAVFHRFHDDSQYQIHQFSRKIVGKSTEEFVSSFLVDQKWNSDHKKCRNQLGSTCRWS